MRRLFLLPIVLLALVSLLPAGSTAASASSVQNETALRVLLQTVSAKIEPHILQQLQNGSTPSTLIVFVEQANVSNARNFPTKELRGAFVLDGLRTTADRTQGTVRAILNQNHLTYRAFYIANVIAVENLDANVAAQIAARREVARIVADPNVRLAEPAAPKPAQAAHGIEWNLQKIGADKLWHLHIRGKGIVVANQDTGVQWEHPALKQKYRGYNAATGRVNHNYNWWDAVHHAIADDTNPCGFSSPKPCDDEGHGTHTMGTMVGRAGPNHIGVAPAAKWISCRNMDDGVGRPSTYMECFEFFLAPWNSRGENPDPKRAPDVVSNSWICPAEELCDANTLQTATDNLRAAGIFVAASAGNDGSDCSTVSDPPSIYDSATSVGATDINDTLAVFSSRGPVTSDGSNRRKPDISAPGVNVRSSFPKNGYATLSGTSMASPHLAGAVALLWQAVPSLRGDIDATETRLFNSAIHTVQVEGSPSCGGTTPNDIPNNFFGYGRLDVFKAYKNAP